MIDSEFLVERSRLKSQVTTWRALSFLILMIAIFFTLSSSEKIKKIKESPYIARITIDQIIYEDQDRLDIIKEISEDDKVKAVIVHINSPGGTAVGGETLYKSLKKLNSKKPVVVVMDSIATSAAYLTALGAEHIMAQQGTITGSIGVIMEIPNIKEAADKLGIKMDFIKTSPLKGSPSPFEPKNEQAFKVLDEMMQDFYKYFVELISTERGISNDEAIALADGRVFSGKSALDNKLIDSIGNEDDAFDWLVTNKQISSNLKIKEVKLYYPKEPFEEIFNSISQNFEINSLLGKLFSFKGLTL